MSYYGSRLQRLHYAGLCTRCTKRKSAPDRSLCLECLREHARKSHEATLARRPPDLERRRVLRATWPETRDGGHAKCPRCGLRGDHECLTGTATRRGEP